MLKSGDILENWIIRTNNGLSQVSYFSCWSQRGTGLIYQVHQSSFCIKIAMVIKKIENLPFDVTLQLLRRIKIFVPLFHC